MFFLKKKKTATMIHGSPCAVCVFAHSTPVPRAPPSCPPCHPLPPSRTRWRRTRRSASSPPSPPPCRTSSTSTKSTQLRGVGLATPTVPWGSLTCVSQVVHGRLLLRSMLPALSNTPSGALHITWVAEGEGQGVVLFGGSVLFGNFFNFKKAPRTFYVIYEFRTFLT